MMLQMLLQISARNDGICNNRPVPLDKQTVRFSRLDSAEARVPMLHTVF